MTILNTLTWLRRDLAEYSVIFKLDVIGGIYHILITYNTTKISICLDSIFIIELANIKDVILCDTYAELLEEIILNIK